ncbi:hypothetical protein M9Q43_13020 [Flavobacterium sp. HXWNR29]|uniref:hypothetical protein n=1 Tax=Flavobacterium odoriferum TaxID=2946604 RepID=UPI0021CAE957|nr:hypothetical protein [Flavobacterium sp. HXWNR29]MCU4190077.1 hypothetical protein [Flavobacterium sp. HXWNR29]
MKKIIFALILCSFSILSYSQTSVSGVVTYYFNEYQGNKPDLGASVTLIDSAKVKNFDYKLYEKFYYGKFYQKMYFSSLERYEKYSAAYKKTEGKKKMAEQSETFKKGMEDAQKDMERHMKELVKYDSETPEKAAKISTELYMQLLKLDDDLPKKTVDANGNYSLNAKPGVYYVLIKSKNRTGSYDILESDGKIYIKKVKISENDNKDVSYNFEL